MFGLIYVSDRVSWIDLAQGTHHGIVVALSDDATWADVHDLERDEIIQLPIAILSVSE